MAQRSCGSTVAVALRVPARDSHKEGACVSAGAQASNVPGSGRLSGNSMEREAEVRCGTRFGWVKSDIQIYLRRSTCRVCQAPSMQLGWEPRGPSNAATQVPAPLGLRGEGRGNWRAHAAGGVGLGAPGGC